VSPFLRFAGIPPTAARVGSYGALLVRRWVRLGTVFVTGIVLEYLQTVERLGDLRQNRIVPAIELPQRGGIRQVEFRQPVRRAVQLGEHFARGEVECLKFVPGACEDLQGRTACQVDPLQGVVGAIQLGELPEILQVEFRKAVARTVESFEDCGERFEVELFETIVVTIEIRKATASGDMEFDQ